LNLTNSQKSYLQIIGDLHQNWQPHSGQLEIGKKLISGDIQTLFIQCGRKWGKTEFAMYMLWRHALLNPGSACYYVTPTMTHGRKLVWTDPRLSSFGDVKYIKKINSNEMIVYFKNGSFIQVIGSENFQGANGLRPSFLVYDEFCEFHHRFHETMNPNRIVYNCPLVIIGTPPMQDSLNREQYIMYADECKESEDCLWIRQTSYSNPHIDAKELDKEKARIIARGEDYIWYSQYEALITAGGANVVFPMLKKEDHVFSHEIIHKEIFRDLNKLEWYCISDPGTTTVMAFLFIAVNPYTKKIYILDEMYEKGPQNTSVRVALPKALQKAKSLYPRGDFGDDWYKTYDEAAAWFCNEVMNQYGLYFSPTAKLHNRKEEGISLIKDILIHKVIMISDRCEKLFWEMTNYVADENGKFPKKNDHLIDCFRYFLAAANYNMVSVMEAVRNLGPRRPEDINDGNQKWEDPWAGDDWTGIFE